MPIKRYISGVSGEISTSVTINGKTGTNITLTKSDIGLSDVINAEQVKKDELDILVPTIQPNGKIKVEQTPIVAANLVSVSDKTERLALSNNINLTICLQADTQWMWALNANDDPIIEANWIDCGSTAATVVSVNGATGMVTITCENIGAVPVNRKINNKVLNDDITLTINDIITLPNDTTKFLRGDGVWATPEGTGGIVGDSLTMSFPYAENINAGTVVKLINDNGITKVQNITRINSSPTQILGSGTQNTISIDSTSYPFNCIIPVGGNCVVIAYVRTTGVYVRLGTVVGTTVTLQGSEIQVSTSTNFFDMIPLDNEHFAIAYGTNASPKMKVGKISGIAISLSLEVSHNYGGCFSYKLGKVSASRVIMVAHSATTLYNHLWDWNTGNPPTITSATYNYITITPSWSGDGNNGFSIAFDGNGRFMYTTRTNGAGYYGAFVVWSNGTITSCGGNYFSDSSQISSSIVAISSTLYLGVTYDSTNYTFKVRLFSFINTGTPAILSTQTLTTLGAGYCDSISVALLANGYAAVVVKNNTITAQKLYIIQYSQTAITNVTYVGEALSNISTTTGGMQNGRSFATFPSTNIAVAVGYKNTPNIEYKVHQIGGLIVDFLGVIGIAQETKTTEQNGNVTLLGGISNCHNSLVPASKLFIQSDGSIGNTATPYFLGYSLSNTKLLLNRGMY